MKTNIICKTNENGNTIFECGKCGKSIPAVLVAVKTVCPRCGYTFKKKIVRRNDYELSRKI